MRRMIERRLAVALMGGTALLMGATANAAPAAPAPALVLVGEKIHPSPNAAPVRGLGPVESSGRQQHRAETRVDGIDSSTRQAQPTTG